MFALVLYKANTSLRVPKVSILKRVHLMLTIDLSLVTELVYLITLPASLILVLTTIIANNIVIQWSLWAHKSYSNLYHDNHN